MLERRWLLWEEEKLAWEGMLPSTAGGGMTVVAGEVLASLGEGVLVWEGVILSPGIVAIAGEVLASLGEGELTLEGMLPSTAGGFAWEVV